MRTGVVKRRVCFKPGDTNANREGAGCLSRWSPVRGPMVARRTQQSQCESGLASISDATSLQPKDFDMQLLLSKGLPRAIRC